MAIAFPRRPRRPTRDARARLADDLVALVPALGWVAVIRRRAPITRSTKAIARTELKRSRKRIASQSEKVLAQLPDRARTVDQAWQRDRGQCRAEHLVPEVRCGGPLDVHEIIPRSAWPGGQYVLTNVLLVCRRHHDWIGNFPEAAHEIGLHGFSWERLRVVDG